MATETEIKLSLSARSANELAKHALLNGVAPQRQLLVNTYYETPDNRLRNQGVVVRHRQKGKQCLLTVKTAPELTAGLARRREWEFPSRAGEFDFSQVDSRSIRTLLESVRSELRPVSTTRFRRDSWLLDPRTGVRIELALDRGWIEAGGRREAVREIELELLTGSLADLFALVADLQASVPLHPEVLSKSERAHRLLLAQPLTAVKSLPVPLAAEMPSIAAFRTIVLACLGHLQSNEKGVCESEDPEFVHQARVAIRRLRSAIRLWQPLLPEEFVARFDPLWRDLGTKLGETRNWDVFRDETLPILGEAFPGSDLDRLARHAVKSCANSRRDTRKALRSPEYSRLLIGFTAAVLGLTAAGAGKLGVFVPPCLKRRAKRVKERARAAAGPDVAARHRLRVAFKQLRYAVEFFSPILSAPHLNRYLQAATALQELLGRLNDLAVASQLISEALPGRKGEAIVHWLAIRSESLLPEFGRLLDEFQQQRAPWKVP